MASDQRPDAAGFLEVGDVELLFPAHLREDLAEPRPAARGVGNTEQTPRRGRRPQVFPSQGLVSAVETVVPPGSCPGAAAVRPSLCARAGAARPVPSTSAAPALTT